MIMSKSRFVTNTVIRNKCGMSYTLCMYISLLNHMYKDTKGTSFEIGRSSNRFIDPDNVLNLFTLGIGYDDFIFINNTISSDIVHDIADDIDVLVKMTDYSDDINIEPINPPQNIEEMWNKLNKYL